MVARALPPRSSALAGALAALTLAGAGACGTSAASTGGPAGPRAGATRRAAPPAPPSLPAGMYFRVGHYEQAVFADDDQAPPAPAFALVLGESHDPAELTRLARDGGAGLPPGYPWLVSWTDLGPADARTGGFAVVAGLYAQRADAERARARLGRAGAEVVALSDQGRDWSQPPGAPDDGAPAVIQLDGDAPAWSAEDLERVEADLDERLGQRWVPLDEQRARRRAALAGLTPRCSARAGAHIAPYQRLFRFRRAYAPVRCPDGREAWVAWTSTRLESVVYRQGDAWIIEQVTLVECDQATFERWRLGPAGREPLPVAPPDPEGC